MEEDDNFTLAQLGMGMTKMMKQKLFFRKPTLVKDQLTPMGPICDHFVSRVRTSDALCMS